MFGASYSRRPGNDRHRAPRNTMSLIFVVDDDPDVRELVEYKLRQEGHQVLSAVNGQDALRLVPAAAGLDLLLLDVMMPGLTGFDVLARLREAAATRALPIILLTAKAQESDAERGFSLGANDYVLKPFSPRELMSRVNAQLVNA
jgi:DNA-binding response OmpR family regulator